MNSFTFNDHSCSEFGIYVSGEGTFNSPELDTTSYSIPGRNGDLILSNGRFKNITVVYPAFIRTNFRANAEKARAWLLNADSYSRLEDDYHPDTFRLAKFNGPIDFDMHFLNHSGECKLSFNCKPQRFLKDGETTIEISSGDSVKNNTAFDALPLIEVMGTGAGALTVGKYTLEFSTIDSSITIDCDLQDAYRGTLNKNNTVSGTFPKLSPGDNIISWTGEITSVSITPRWWIL